MAIGAISVRSIRDETSGFGLDLQVELRVIVLAAETSTAKFKKMMRIFSDKKPRRRRNRPVQVKSLPGKPTELLHLVITQPMVRSIQPGRTKPNGKRGRALQRMKRMSPSEMADK